MSGTRYFRHGLMVAVTSNLLLVLFILDLGAQTGAPRGHGNQHGTPAGWKFAWPGGDPARGRAVFAKLECYSCHEVRGETFPAPSDGRQLGPELAAMGPLHEPEYFAEAIINPNAVVEEGKGYRAPDGSSKMPSYNDSVTVQEVIDLVAFLRSLRLPAAAGGRPGAARWVPGAPPSLGELRRHVR